MVSVPGPTSELVARYSDIAVAAAEFLAWFVALSLVGRFLVVPAVERLLAARRVEPTLRQAMERVVRAVVVLVAVAVGLTAAGFGYVVGGSTTIVAALTVALGFAARDVIGDLASGVFIVADPRFNIGDWIEWKDEIGVIDAVGFRTTGVRTFNNELITVPNSELATNAVTNAVIGRRLRIVHSFEFQYDTDIDAALSILTGIARRHGDVLDEPPPSALVVDLDGASVTVESRYWIADPTHDRFRRVRSEYLQAVKARFDALDIELDPSSDGATEGVEVRDASRTDLERD